MEKISQKQAVVDEVNTILGTNFNPQLPAKDQLSKDQISMIRANIVHGIMNDTISFYKEINSQKDVEKYVSGMVSNHFRKAKELNGGSSYSPQSTGRGSRDPQIQALSELLKTTAEGTTDHNEIVSAIADRRLELATSKSEEAKEKRKKKQLAELDVNALPENLKGLASDLINEIVD